MQIPGIKYFITEGTIKARSRLISDMKTCGAIRVKCVAHAELLVSCLGGAEGPVDKGVMRDDDLLVLLFGQHTFRNTTGFRDAIRKMPCKSQPLAGKSVIVIGNLREQAVLFDEIRTLGGTVIAAPSTEADVVIMGEQDDESDRCRTVLASQWGRAILSQWELFDLSEAARKYMPPSKVQINLATKVRLAYYTSAQPLHDPQWAIGF